jgi:hypothetical protein
VSFLPDFHYIILGSYWSVTIRIVNPIGIYNRPSNYAQEAMEASLSEMQSEVQEYAKEKKLSEQS